MDQHYDGSGWDQLAHVEPEQQQQQHADQQHEQLEQELLEHIDRQQTLEAQELHEQEQQHHEQQVEEPGAGQQPQDVSEQYHEAVPGKPQTTKRAREAGEARRKVDPRFICPIEGCGATFTRSHNLAGHLRSHSGAQPYRCEVCNRGFGRQHDCKRHEKLHLTGGSSKKLAVVESLSHTPRKDPAPTQEVQNEAAYTNFMGGDDFAGGSASLHDLALILGEGNYVFQELPAQVEPEPEPAVEPVSEEEGRANVQAAIHEYARAFSYVHGTPPSRPPPPYPALPSPFDQTLSPPEVLVWISHCPYPDMAKDTENLRLFVRLMGWMPPSSSTAGPTTSATPDGGAKRKAEGEHPDQPTPRKLAQDRAMDELVDPGLFSDDHAHGQMHLDYSALPEPAADGSDGQQQQEQPQEQHQHADQGEFGVPSGDLLHAFPLPDELNHPDDGPAYPHMTDAGVPPPQPPPLLDAHAFVAAIASAAGALPLDGASSLLAAAADPDKPKPALRTGPRKKRSKPAVPAAHPCEHVDADSGERCGKVFARTFDLKRHVETVHVPKSQSAYSCEKCSKTFSRADALVRHRKIYCQRKVQQQQQQQQQGYVAVPPHPDDLYLSSAAQAYDGGYGASAQYGESALHYHDDLGDLRNQH